MKRVIIAGSPRSRGRCAHLAEMLFEASIDERPDDELYLAPVSELDIAPCIACDGCRALSEVVFTTDDGEEERVRMHRCVINDDMQDLYDQLDVADELVIVAPVFFSGAPAPLKALLDRLQPYFWAREDARKAPGYAANRPPKRPATLHVVGEGGDPFGYAPLVSEVRSSIACAGFAVERVLDWVGKIDPSGEILAEAEVVEVGPPAGSAAAKAAVESEDPAATNAPEPSHADDHAPSSQRSGQDAHADSHTTSDRQTASTQRSGQSSPAKKRPKLDIRSRDKGARRSNDKPAQDNRPGRNASKKKRRK